MSGANNFNDALLTNNNAEALVTPITTEEFNFLDDSNVLGAAIDLTSQELQLLANSEYLVDDSQIIPIRSDSTHYDSSSLLSQEDSFVVNSPAIAEPLSNHSPKSYSELIADAIALNNSLLTKFLNQPNFEADTRTAFGDGWSITEAVSLIKDLIASKALPEIETVPVSLLKAKGAFAGEKIYLSHELLESKNTAEIAAVLLEEVGHYLDSRLNTSDSEGDEGEIFSKLVRGLIEDASTLGELKAENDFATFTLSGKKIEIEKAALETGVFTADESGKVRIDWMADAGSYQGELAIFSLEGMENLTPGSSEYIKEATRRALTNSTEGYVILSDTSEAAKLSGELGEANRNEGKYSGVREFNFTAGTQVAFLLVPKGTVREVFENPTVEGSKRPLFSIAAANPLGKEHLGKLAEGMFAIEDVRFDSDSDADYNDLIISVRGLTGEVTPIEELMDLVHDWRSTEMGQQLMSFTNDDTAPTIELKLLEDTGFDPNDKITNQGTLVGKVSDDSQIVKLEASIDGKTNWLDLSNLLQLDGSFTIERTKLEEINGSVLNDGLIQLYLKATDSADNTSEPFQFTFTLQESAPPPPEQIALVNDTDFITSNNRPSVTGVAPTGHRIELRDGETLLGETTAVDGKWQINSNIVLSDGVRQLSAVAIDPAGNISTPVSFAVTIDTIAPQLIVTSPQNQAKLFAKTRLKGTVNGTGSPITQLSYQLGDLPAKEFAFDGEGRFDIELNLEGLAAGEQILAIKTSDAAGTSITTQIPVVILAQREEIATTSDTSTLSAFDSLSISNSDIASSIALPPATIKTEGKLIVNGSSDFDGQPLDLSDDTFIYAGKGFRLNGNSVLPAERDSAGNPILIGNKQQLRDYAVTVAPDYDESKAPGNKYLGLIPPQTVPKQTVTVPSFEDILIQILTEKVPTGTLTVTFDPTKNPLNNATDWTNKFPSPGTATQPKVVKISQGNLNIPAGVNLTNYVIIVEDGNINFNGSGHDLDNLTLIAERGNINLPGQVKNNDSSVLAGRSINVNGESTFTGKSLIASGNSGNITFSGQVTALSTSDNLKVIAGANLTFSGAVNTRGDLFSGGNFTFNGSSIHEGTISSKGDLRFNGNTVITAISDPTPPTNRPPTDILLNPNRIAENTANSMVVGTLTTTDSDSNDTHTYSLVTGVGDTDNNAFTIAGNTLKLNASADFETQSSYSVRLRTTDSAGNSFDKVLNVSVTNVNEAPTALTLDLLSFNENLPAGEIIGTFTTNDPDVGNTHSYSLVAGSGDTNNDAFTIVGDRLKINSIPDFEARSSYSIRVKTTDNGGLSTEQVLILTVNDINEVPSNLSLTSSNIDENLPASSLIGDLYTIDPDSGDSHGYQLVAGEGDTDNNAFTIVGSQLLFNKTADFETKSNYNIRVRTTDTAGNNLEKILFINVGDINEAPTALILSSTTLDENFPVNTPIGTFTTIDPDAGDLHTYNLVAGEGDTNNHSFTIVGNELHYLETPDFEQLSNYSIRVRTTDAEGLSFERVITINVADINEAPYDLSLSSTNIDENVAAATTIATLSASDPDFNDTFNYSLVAGEGDRDNHLFTIVGNELKINNSPDFETQASYSIRLRASDVGGLSVDKIVEISVNDKNEPPIDLNLSSTNIDENAPAGSTVAILTTVDPDANSTASYNLVPGEGSTDNNAFTIVGNELKLNDSPDFETKSNYSIRVRTTDDLGLSFDRVVAIAVNNLNEAPTEINLSSVSLDENTAADTTVAILTTVDPDASNSHNYSLVTGDGDTDNGAFTIVGNQLKINSVADFESKASYSIRIRATDAEELFFDKVVTISVNDVKEAPTEIHLSATSIDENSAIATTVAVLNGIDSDANENLSYALVTGLGDTDNSAFSIVGNELKINTATDFESQPSYGVRISVTDKDGLTFEKAVTISVNDINEAPIDLNLSQTSIDENASSPAVVGTFSTTDPDFGSTHSYSLVEGEGDTDNHLFSLDGDRALLNNLPDFEAQSSYSIRVRTTDAGGLFFDRAISISVNNLEEPPTQINLSATTVDENVTSDTLVGTFDTLDPDGESTHSYSLVTGEGDGDNASFTIVGNELRLGEVPNFETKSNYTIRVRSTDAEGLWTEQIIALAVNDLNEAPTQIFLNNASIGENSANGTQVGQLSTDDPDLADNLTYTLTDDAEGRFTITDGRLVVADGSKLDYEIATTHQVEIQATDAGGLSTTTQVEIAVTNDVKDDLPILEIALENDTGTSDRDKITNQATITGRLDSPNHITTFKAGLDEAVGSNYLDLISYLNSDLSFTLDSSALEEINGNRKLADGEHTIIAIAIDEYGNSTGEINYTFTLDSTAPTLDLLTPLADGDHSSTIRAIGDVEDASSTTIEVTSDGETTTSTTVNSQGHFDTSLSETGLSEGSHTAAIAATDVAGNSTEQTLNFQVTPDFVLGPNESKGWGASTSEEVILGEQDSFVTQTTIPLELGMLEGARTLRFDVDTWFDGADKSSNLEDQLLVYLVDPADPTQTLLDSGTPGGALFSLSGNKAEFRAGLVRFDGKSVEIDLTSLKDKTSGLLEFQLINHDGDINSIVRVSNITNVVEPLGTEKPVFPLNERQVDPSEALNLSQLQTSSDLEVQLNNVRLDETTGKYSAEVVVRNTGEEALARQVAVLFPNLPAGVLLENASGTDSDGTPYISMRSAINNGGLDKGAISDAVTIVFDDPDLLRTPLQPVVLSGGANIAPVFEAIAPINIMPGQKLEVPLVATDANGDTVTFNFSPNGKLPTGELQGDGKLIIAPTPDEVGTYQFTLIATDGVLNTTQDVTINVVADPITTTRISGVIQNTDTNPLAGITIEFDGIETTTADDGSFLLELPDNVSPDAALKIHGEEVDGDGVYPFIAEKLPMVLGHDLYSNVNNVISRPIYLPPLDVANAKTINPNQDITVTTDKIPGASVFVEAGSLSTSEGGEPFMGKLSITEVPVELTPAALPENLSPDLVVTIQPGEMVFNTPAPLSLPNLSGWNSGMEMDLWSINPVTGEFDNVGTGRVSDDGSVIETIEGGIRNSSWHFFTPPIKDPKEDERNKDDLCDECENGVSGTSEIKSHSGALIETHDLVSYQSNGISRGITLTYDSLRADPRPIVHFGLELGSLQWAKNRRLTAKLSFKDANGFAYFVPGRQADVFGPNFATGLNIWTIPDGNLTTNAALQADLSHFNSGKYEYNLNVGLRILSSYKYYDRTSRTYINIPYLSGSDSSNNKGELLHVNAVNSSFGSGWSISGWQEIVENKDGSLMLIDGDGSELLFEEKEENSNGVTTVSANGSSSSISSTGTIIIPQPDQGAKFYNSPPGDFSTLERLEDDTYRRTMKDQTVYTFNQNKKLSSVSDSVGNVTQYIYDENKQLVKIIDPVGLETVFTYNEAGKVSSITDPANRQTLLSYDGNGNLIGITNPDNSTRTWEYDTRHHMIAEIDQRGNREEAVYQYSGRVVKAIRKDGSQVQVTPVQLEGLYRPEDTIDLVNPAPALGLNNRVSSNYADANGNVTVTQLDQAGQALSSTDGEGSLPSVARNQDNLITNSIDARGNTTEYTYDERGNVTSISQPLSDVTEIETSSNILTQVDYPTGASPQTLNSQDLNKDGNNDLITFNGNNTFSVLSGDEANIFQPKRDYSIGGTKDTSLLADFNEDGYSEVVSLDNSGNLSLRNGGETGFSALKTYNSINLDNTAEISFAKPDYTGAVANLAFLVDTSQFDFLNLVSISGNKPFKQPDYIDVANPQPTTIFAKLNADNLEDRVSLGNGTTFSVELANANGTFATPRNYSFSGGESSLITAGDVDNDGDDDVLVASRKFIVDATRAEGGYYQSYLTVFKGRGDGTLFSGGFYSGLFSEPYSYPETFVLKDVENDGILDWIAYDRDKLEVRPIRYDASTGQLFWFTPTLTKEPKYLAVSDFVDRYNSQDIIATDATQTQLSLVSFYTTKNDFDIFRVYDPDSRASIRRSSHTLSNSSDYVAVEDLDKDNRYDWITVAEDRSKVTISLKNSDGSNKSQNTITFDDIPSSVNLGDLNEDGNYDLLAVYESTVDFFAYFGKGDGTFANPVTYNLPGEYDTPILRDLDADGDEDLIAVATDASGNKTFSVFLNDGSGNYAEPFSHTLAGNPNSFVLKDLDADGDEDLIAVNSLNKQITVVTNQNNTGFSNSTSYTLTNFDYLSFQDLDGDTDLDLLTVTENQQSFSLLFNQGDGSFGTASNLKFANSVQYLALKDLNGDNHLDVIGSFDALRQQLFTAFGRADGTYSPTTTYSLSATPTNLVFRDLDENGVSDLIAINTTQSKVEVFLTFETTTNGVVSTTTNKQTLTTAILPQSVGFADLDSDSDLDLVVSNSNQTAYSIRLNNGSGSFGSEYRTNVNLTTAPAHLSLTNIDGINGLDLLAANEDKSQFSILFNQGNFTFGAQNSFNFSTNLTNSIWRDVNSDGILDLISTNDEHSAVSVFLGNSDGSFGEEMVYEFTSNPTYVSVGDLDGNNRPDVIGIKGDKSQVTTIKTNQDGTKTPETSYLVGIESASNLTVDLDGDGDSDTVTANANSNTVTVKLNRGDGTNAPEVNYTVGSKPVAIVAEDFNRDGYLDIAAANTNSNNISILYGIGSGIFVNSLVNPNATAITDRNRPFDTKLFDLNNDSYLDLVAADYNRDRISVLLGKSDGSFKASTNYQVGNNPYSVEIADLDNDELVDLVTTNYFNNTVSVLKGLGNGTFGVATNYAVGNNPRAVAIDDFNGDGVSDLVTANYGNRTVSVLLGNGDGEFATSTSYNTTYSNPTDVAVADFNLDGKKDVVVSSQSGYLSILLGNGNGGFTNGSNLNVAGNLFDVEVADLNRDGRVDLVTVKAGNVSVFYGTGNGLFESRKDYSSGSFPPVNLEIAEFNGDSLPEIVIFSSNNDFSILKNKGDQNFERQQSGKLGNDFVGFAVGDSNGDDLADLTALSFGSDGKSVEVTRTTSPFFNETLYTYDPKFNRVTSFTDELGRKTLYEIDPTNGNLDSETLVVGKLGGEDDLITRYTYTDAGLVDSMSDPEGRVTDYDYDEYGRLIKETLASGTADEAVRQYEYDAAGNQTAVIDEMGNRTEFEYDAMNRVTKITEADPDGNGELTNPVTTYTYDSSGNLVKTIDANNNVTENEYDELNRLSKITDAEGKETEFEYDSAGNLTQVTDAEARESQNIYDSRNRLIAVIDPLGNKTQYQYDLDNNLIATIDPLGNKTQYVYDARGRLIKQIDAFGNSTTYSYDRADNLVEVVDKNGNKTKYTYDELNREIARINPNEDKFKTNYDKVSNVISTTDELGRVTSFDYDERDRLTNTTNAENGVAIFQYDDAGNLLAFSDELNRTTTYTYDALNRQVSVKDPLNHVTTTNYDSVGNVTTITDPLNNTTTYSYDALNRVNAVTNAEGNTVTTEYDGMGNVTAVTDELDRTTEFGYNDRNEQTSVTNALGHTTKSEYDSLGNLISVTDTRGNTTSYEYDKLYRLITEIDANSEDVSYQYDAVGNLLGFTDELDRTTTYGYDALNRQISVSDPLNHLTTNQYDKVGNLISVTDANNHTTEYGYDLLNRLNVVTNHLGDTVTTQYDQVGNVTAITDELDRTTTFTYDERNFQTSITDPLNHTSTTSYDALGNIISITDPLNHTTTYAYDELYRLTQETDAENRTTVYSYDPASNLISLTDPEQNTTSYTYDNLNRLVTDTNQLGDTRSYQYDEVGNQIGSIDRNGREINYTYDPLNRNTAEIWLDNDGNPIRTFNYQYDAASQLIDANDPDSAYSYDYDLDGRVTSVDNAGTPGVPNVVFNYTYDPVDNLTSVTDSIDGVNKGIETFAYDELDRVTSITQSGDGVSEKRVDYQYDAASQMSQVERYKDLAGINKISESNYKFDEAGRLIELNHLNDDEVISAYDWAYDAANRITQATSPDGVSDYNYDNTNQLVDAQYDYQENENYVYDDNGNRINEGYVTDENNQLLSDGKYNYEYDGEGNRTKRTSIATGEVTEYSWDYRNRLVDVVTKDADGNVIANSDYTYDVFDRRIGKSVDADGDGAGEAVVERFVYDGDHIALTFDGEGNQTERFLHGARIDEVIAQENESGEVLWALADNLGSVRVLLDNDGNVVNNITYDAFGNITVESNPDVNFRFSYTGRELDSETGNYYYRSRYYDPAIGQFINEDTIGFAGGDANLYRYTFNSPLNYRDPDGKLVWAIPVAVGTAIVVGGILYQLKKSTEALVEDIPKVFPDNNPFSEQDPNQKPKKPKEPPLAPWIEETDPLKINPEEKNDDFFNPDKPDSWFDKQKELTEEVKEENDKKEEDNNSGTCPAPWASNDDNPDPQASNEPQNSGDGDGQPEGGSENSSDPWADVSPEDFDEFVNTEPDYDPRPTTPGGRILSEHADLDSLDRHRFSEPYGDVDAIIDNPTRVTQQRDGANVYIQAQQDGSYNMAVVNPKDNSIVTAMKNLSRQELRSLGRNYGFDTTP